MSKSLKTVLMDLGYSPHKSYLRQKPLITTDGRLIGVFSDGECWNYLRHQHPEYFGEVAK